MNYENYKKYFDGGFFPIDSDHKLVNLENTGEYEVTATTGSGADTKVEKQYKPSCTGLTNMLKDYTGGSRFEALTQSQGHTFIPELADCTTYTGAKKAIIDHYRAANEPYKVIVDAPIDPDRRKENDIYTIFVKPYNDEDEAYIKILTESGYSEEKLCKGEDYITFEMEIKSETYFYIWAPYDILVQCAEMDDASIYKAVYSPIYRSFDASSNTQATFASKYANYLNVLDDGTEIYSIETEINTNSAFEYYNSVFTFGAPNDIVNINTGLADWLNLEGMSHPFYSKKHSELNLYCKNLYFDWKELDFSQLLGLTITIYPDPVTFKTAVTYFATKATFASGVLPSVKILNASGQEEMYEWAQQYADKFDSIEKL